MILFGAILNRIYYLYIYLYSLNIFMSISIKYIYVDRIYSDLFHVSLKITWPLENFKLHLGHAVGQNWWRKNLFVPLSLSFWPKSHLQQFPWCLGEDSRLERLGALWGSRQTHIRKLFERNKAETCQVILCKSRAIAMGPSGRLGSQRCQPAMLQCLLSRPLQSFLVFLFPSWATGN